MKKSRLKTPFTVCIIISLVCMAIFTVRLVDWQLVNGSSYKLISAKSTNYSVETDAVRGEILDCNGEGMVVNTTRYKIVIDKLYADETKLSNTTLRLISLLEKTGDKWNDNLPIDYSDGYRFREKSDDEIADMKELAKIKKEATAAECISALKERYSIPDGYTEEQLRKVLSVRYGMEREGYSNAKPYTFADDISRNAMNAVSENTQGISGVEVQTYLVRRAENATLAPHILGALGSISQEEYNELSKGKKEYQLTDTVGKFGIEQVFEQELKGVGGTKIIRKNSDGSIIDTVETIDSKPGNSVFLTIDSRLQKTAAQSLEKNIKDAKEYGKAEVENKGKSLQGEDCESGAAVMLSVKDFSVLAAVSYPTYDLNKYSEYGDYYVKLTENKNSPMFNRAFTGTFAWGSVFKPCVALAALEEKIITPKTEIFCTEKYDYYPTNVVRCMHRHENEDLKGAITESCNYYFAETGRRLGIENMYLYAEKLGFGEYTGVEIDESRGTLAGRDSTTWEAGNTVSAAIGQSDNSFTPVQLATYAATIANNGTRLKTHLVSKITDYTREKTVKSFDKAQKVDTSGVSSKNMKTVQEAMLSVTQSEKGTAHSVFGDYKVKVAAKTGTAENSGSDHTTFICYAPYDKPEVAISVVLEHGVKGTFSMQVAKDLLDEYFKNKDNDSKKK